MVKLTLASPSRREGVVGGYEDSKFLRGYWKKYSYFTERKLLRIDQNRDLEVLLYQMHKMVGLVGVRFSVLLAEGGV